MKFNQSPIKVLEFENESEMKNFINEFIEEKSFCSTSFPNFTYKLDDNITKINTSQYEDIENIYYIIEFHYNDKIIIKIYRSYKDPMIQAAIDGNIVEYKIYFKPYQNMINMSGEFAIMYNHLDILNHIYSNGFELTNDPIYRCIIFDNVDAINLLLKFGVQLKHNWLVQALEYNAHKILKDLFFEKRTQIGESPRTNYFQERLPYYKGDKDEIINHLIKYYGYNPQL